MHKLAKTNQINKMRNFAVKQMIYTPNVQHAVHKNLPIEWHCKMALSMNFSFLNNIVDMCEDTLKSLRKFKQTLYALMFGRNDRSMLSLVLIMLKTYIMDHECLECICRNIA